ncbi:MAG: 2-hydroxyacid dehydrogenase [Alphaproteobacteria bacterium]|nr:2-hydroxyacid dehydrogenase [Alphaproteobacteria bacterium]
MSGLAAAPAPRVRVACTGFVFDPVAETVIRSVAPESFDLVFAPDATRLSSGALAATDILLTVAPVTDEMLRRAPRLRFIQKWGTGYEKIDTAAAARHGVTVAITSGANAETIAEHALMLMLAVLRRVVVADRALRAGRWSPADLRPICGRLVGKTVGLVGFGNIGRALARLLTGFAAPVLYARPSGAVAPSLAWGATHVPLAELLARSDVVSLHCPGGARNRHMIGAAQLAAMKPGAVLINVARGELVVEADLVDALRGGRLSGAGLDVFAEEPLRPDSPLRALDSVVLTPHSAGSLMEDVAIMGRHSFANMLDFLAGRPIRPADLVVAPERPRP